METKVWNGNIEVGADRGDSLEGIDFGHDESVQPHQPGIVGGLSLDAAVVPASGGSIYASGVDSEFHDHNVNPTYDTF
jgi:hypothetical protein